MYPEASRVFCAKIEHILRNNLDIRMTSGCRTKAHNLRVGGVENSQHLYGLAVDLQGVSGNKNAKIVKLARQAGLVPFTYQNHVHVQMFNAYQFR